MKKTKYLSKNDYGLLIYEVFLRKFSRNIDCLHKQSDTDSVVLDPCPCISVDYCTRLGDLLYRLSDSSKYNKEFDENELLVFSCKYQNEFIPLEIGVGLNDEAQTILNSFRENDVLYNNKHTNTETNNSRVKKLQDGISTGERMFLDDEPCSLMNEAQNYIAKSFVAFAELLEEMYGPNEKAKNEILEYFFHIFKPDDSKSDKKVSKLFSRWIPKNPKLKSFSQDDFIKEIRIVFVNAYNCTCQQTDEYFHMFLQLMIKITEKAIKGYFSDETKEWIVKKLSTIIS